jgi:hypothetical protein
MTTGHIWLEQSFIPAAMKKPDRSIQQRLLRAAGFPFVLALALWLWMEDWLWEPLSRLMQYVGALPVLRQIETLIRRAPPWLALACFGVPIVVLLPFKFAGVWLFAKGHYLTGGSMFLGAKIAGTAVAARIYTLTRDSLMTLEWFANLHARFIKLREYVFCRVRRTRAWRLIHLLRRQLQRFMRKLRH